MLGFPLSDQGDIPVMDLSKHETRRFHDSQGREIAVFDGLVDKVDLDTLRLFLLQYNSVFAYQAYDGQDEEHDNVSWIAMLKVFIFYLLPIAHLLLCRGSMAEGEKGWEVYRIWIRNLEGRGGGLPYKGDRGDCPLPFRGKSSWFGSTKGV